MKRSVLLHTKNVIISRLSHGCDLLEELTGISQRKHVSLGKVEAIGALSHAVIGFYDQKTFEYKSMHLDGAYEIASLLGNISLTNGKPIVHAHIVLADEKGRAVGGHLMHGNLVFACEAIITVYQGEKLERSYDKTTRLPLWEL